MKIIEESESRILNFVRVTLPNILRITVSRTNRYLYAENFVRQVGEAAGLGAWRIVFGHIRYVTLLRIHAESFRFAPFLRSIFAVTAFSCSP